MSDGGKGSSPRPLSVSNQEYAERWDAIFGREKREKALDEYIKVSQEIQSVDDTENPLINKNPQGWDADEQGASIAG